MQNTKMGRKRLKAQILIFFVIYYLLVIYYLFLVTYYLLYYQHGINIWFVGTYYLLFIGNLLFNKDLLAFLCFYCRSFFTCPVTITSPLPPSCRISYEDLQVTIRTFHFRLQAASYLLTTLLDSKPHFAYQRC